MIRARQFHGQDFDYLEKYINNHTPILLKHKKCNHIFKQIPYVHYYCGCPNCNESKGEKRIKTYLIENDIIFFKNYKFDNCRNPINNYHLYFDFAIFDKYNNLKMLIEYDGIQHFRPSDYIQNKKFTKEESLEIFKLQIFRDEIKNEYCINNNIKLLRISYKSINNIYDILNKEIIF